MRKQLSSALLARGSDPHTVFLTGDLGFMALEDLQAAMGARFINAGVAEQNMVTVAAALARQHFEVWVYSIAPFCYARPFEQVRNDVTLHRLPVKLIGNGGGYGYGVMGPTHHAIEDYGVLLTLPGMRVYIPVFDEDVEAVVESIAGNGSPSYLRLGRGESPTGYGIPPYAPWRQLVQGSDNVVIAVGPLAGSYIEAIQKLPAAKRPSLWALAELPLELNAPPKALLEQVERAAMVVIAEEHVRQGGFASQLALYFATAGHPLRGLRHLFARAHSFGRYGSQSYMRQQSGLDPNGLLDALGTSP